MAKTKTPTKTEITTDDSPEALEKLFGELSKARDAGNETLDAPPEKPDEEPTEAASAPAETPSPAPIEAAPEEVPEETKDVPEAPAVAAPAPAPAKIDRSKLTPELQVYFDQMVADKEKLENERRSAVGRAAALDRQLASFKRRQEAEVATPAPAPAAVDDPFATEYPELSKELEARIAKAEKKFGDALTVSIQKTKSDVLDGVFPGWLQKVQTPEFNYWLSQQDEPTQKLFDSDNVRDYAILFESYKRASAAPTPPPAGPSEVDRIQNERAARLERSADVPSKNGAPNPTGEPDESDPEALFNWHSRKRDKERERQTR